MLRRKGIRVVSITEHADDSPTGKLMEAIIESVDEFYSENLAQDVVRGMREAASRGFFLGSKAPFGYKRVKVNDGVKERPTLEVDPATAPVVKEIFESSLGGNGLKEICKTLNDRGVTNRGKRWYKGGASLPADQRSLHGHSRLGQNQQGREVPGPGEGGGSVARAGVEGAVRGRAGGDEGTRAEGAETRESGQQVPAERAAEVWSVRQALLRPGSQERPVRLLRLRHPVQGRRGDVQRPLPERPKG